MRKHNRTKVNQMYCRSFFFVEVTISMSHEAEKEMSLFFLDIGNVVFLFYLFPNANVLSTSFFFRNKIKN